MPIEGAYASLKGLSASGMAADLLLPFNNSGAEKSAAPIAAVPLRKLRLDLDSIMNKLIYGCPADLFFLFAPAGSWSY
jgi:hypothetical protein